MPGNYDPVSFFYDPLARFIFGRSIEKAQAFLLPVIPPGARILIAGGGTGWILEEITKFQPEGLEITYVEISEKMIKRSKKRFTGGNTVIYINKSILDVKPEGRYDIIITPFLFDNFSAQTIKKTILKLDYHLKPGGRWLFTDFNPSHSSPAHNILLKSMYLFFNLMCRLETSTLHNPAPLFRQQGYFPVQEKTFFRGFILSVAYQKQLNTSL